MVIQLGQAQAHFMTDSATNKCAAAVREDYKLILSSGEPWLFDFGQAQTHFVTDSATNKCAAFHRVLPVSTNVINHNYEYRMDLV